MSSVAESVERADVSRLTEAELAEAMLELDREQVRVEAARLAVAGEFDARGVYGFDGAVSAKQWVRQRCDLSSAEASRLLRHAHLARQFEATGAAATSLGTSKLRVLFAAINRRTREAYERDEAMLLELAGPLRVDELRVLVQAWLAKVDNEGTEPPHPHRNELTLTPLMDGRWRFNGELDAETGAMVDSEVRRRADVLYRAHQHCSDEEIWTAAERRGEALAMAFRDAAGIQPGSSTNLPPAFTAIVDLPTLEARTGGIATFDGIGPVRGDTARRLACDAKINRLITDGASAILDAGRTTYTRRCGTYSYSFDSAISRYLLCSKLFS